MGVQIHNIRIDKVFLNEILEVVKAFTSNYRINGAMIEIFDVAFNLIKEIYNELVKRGFDPVFVQTENLYCIY